MTIHQLKTSCWVLDPEPSGDAERFQHYDSRADTLKAISEREGSGPKPKPRPLADCCWIVQCDGECEQIIDEEDECYTVHCESRPSAEDLARTWEWVYSPDGRLVFCPGCASEIAEPIPPSPAELEAAGQLRLPGVA